MITFKEDTHQYFNEDGKELISVTTLMQKHGLAPNYSGVSREVLNAKAQRGSLIHKEIEDYLKYGKIGFTAELANFIKLIKERGTRVIDCEFKVYNDIVAGTVDLLIEENGLYITTDNKTTYNLHIDAVSWQLSIYTYLAKQMFKDIPISEDIGRANHFDKDGNLTPVDIKLKPMAEVERLLECERNGILYTIELVGQDTELMQLYELEALIKSIEDKKQEAEQQRDELRAALMAAMEKQGVKKFENERITITYVAPTTSTSIDSAKLKKDMPAVYEQYSKTSNKKAYLKITLKEG